MTFMHLIGLTLKEAKEHYATIRVTMVDGVPLIGTCDWRPERLNVALRDGKIESIGGMG